VLIRLLFDQTHFYFKYGYSHHFCRGRKFLKNPPSLASHSYFTRLRALCRHMIKALEQLSCPQSAIHGWVGLVMHPTMYALIKMVSFQVPNNSSDVPRLPSFAAPVAIKIAKHLFKRDRMYFTSYKNNHRGCFKMLNNNMSTNSRCLPTPASLAGIRP
jgi:hypothetical protein